MKVLVVDDAAGFAAALRDELEAEEHTVGLTGEVGEGCGSLVSTLMTSSF
ncbi:hypothetical protein [Lentzea cavernae]|uniref:Response regulatory domain-containing protein n=1 Tax=Lentzea cavernae TaxID=2020703 RepID=A0ABQ3MEA9_9PSEU|nr:hypothetical protein [Lentzea cavernae]GHH42171.1 hypothetical protein GCM10017774_38030 [Lentzea cavernae]